MVMLYYTGVDFLSLVILCALCILILLCNLKKKEGKLAIMWKKCCDCLRLLAGSNTISNV